jgi:hypothetical protein
MAARSRSWKALCRRVRRLSHEGTPGMGGIEPHQLQLPKKKSNKVSIFQEIGPSECKNDRCMNIIFSFNNSFQGHIIYIWDWKCRISDDGWFILSCLDEGDRARI